VLPPPTVAPNNSNNPRPSTNKTPTNQPSTNRPDRTQPPNRFGIDRKIKIDPFTASTGDDTQTPPGSPPSTTTPGSGSPITPSSPPSTTTPGGGSLTTPSAPGSGNNEETPGDDLKSAIANSDSIMKKKETVFGAGQTLSGGDLGAQSYPDKNKFKISCANSSNGFAVLIFGVKPDSQLPSTLIVSNVHTEFSQNIIKLDRSLRPQDFIGTILASDTFKQLLAQGEQKATDNYNGLSADFKR
jgi:hypothetical protein